MLYHWCVTTITSGLLWILVIMSTMASQITSVSSVCSTACSGRYKRKHQSSASLAFVRGMWPVNSLHKGPVTWKMFPFNDVIMCLQYALINDTPNINLPAIVKQFHASINWKHLVIFEAIHLFPVVGYQFHVQIHQNPGWISLLTLFVMLTWLHVHKVHDCFHILKLIIFYVVTKSHR